MFILNMPELNTPLELFYKCNNLQSVGKARKEEVWSLENVLFWLMWDASPVCGLNKRNGRGPCRASARYFLFDLGPGGHCSRIHKKKLI